jgi:hypothetical protein
MRSDAIENFLVCGRYGMFTCQERRRIVGPCSVFVRVLLLVAIENGQLLISAIRGQRTGGSRGSSLHLGKCSYPACTIRTYRVPYVEQLVRTAYGPFFVPTEKGWRTDLTVAPGPWIAR